ncbi:MAG: hypothetical protein WC682_01730 [Parcubacteria group bacterium]|jgi:hypothetical protein
MDINIDSIFATIIQISNSFLGSGFFWFIKFILAIYVVVLFVDIVLLLIVRGLGGDLRNVVKGAPMPLVSKKKMQRTWQEIENRLKTKSISQYKVAILEADKLVDEVLMNIGFGGVNMKERLEKANVNQVEEIDNLIEAHEIRNKIIQDDNFHVDKTEAARVIELYREFLDNMEII